MNKSTAIPVGAHLDEPFMPVSGMDEKRRDLYQRIMQFEFDDGPVDLSFAQRLAFENAWSIAFSERVVHEYQRFIFLLASADRPVTPSDQVDQAWHLHLTYTRSYWERLCQDVIGRPLHHTPTRGGSAELHKFDVWYRRALASYRAIFAEPPPSDIWPEPAIRFGDDFYFKRVNTRRHWAIRKPRIIPGSRTTRFLVAAGVLTAFSIATFTASSADDSSREAFWDWFLFFLYFGFPIAMLILLGLHQLLQTRCSICRRLYAFTKTGAVETRENDKKWEEYRCKHCGSCVWKVRESGGGSGSGGSGSSEGEGDDGGGGGGCGGCGS